MGEMGELGELRSPRHPRYPRYPPPLAPLVAQKKVPLTGGGFRGWVTQKVAANSRLFKTIAQQWVEVRPPRRESTKKKTNRFGFP